MTKKPSNQEDQSLLDNVATIVRHIRATRHDGEVSISLSCHKGGISHMRAVLEKTIIPFPLEKRKG